jgi:hypothetical protein
MPALDAAALRALDMGTQRSAPPAAAPAAAAPPAAVAAPPPAAVAPASDRGSSATKTIFGVPAATLPAEEAKPRAGAAAQPAAESAPAPAKSESKAEKKTGARKTKVPAPAIIAVPPSTAAPVAVASASDISRSTREGYDHSGATAASDVIAQRQAPIEERTVPVRTGKKARGASVWTYIGVGFLLGLALLGVYQLYGALAH